MSGIILCRTGRALKPLVLEEPGVQIYSLEELCYYIYNNIYILTNAFLDEKLIAFIRTEIKEPLLADKLEQLKCENAGLAEAVVTILKYVDYYDNGVIGAETFKEAEWYRCKRLKEAGFNAIRSAHHPMSRAMLDACDHIGMMVMDELTDMWDKEKNTYD